MVAPKPKGDGEEAVAVTGADAEAGADPKRDEPKAGAEEAVVAEKGDEPNAGAGDEPNAGAAEEEKADGAVEKEKGEDEVDPAPPELPNAKEVAMAATACVRSPIWGGFARF